MTLLTEKQLALDLGFAERTLREWRRKQLIPHLVIRGKIRYSPDDVTTWLLKKSIAAKGLSGPVPQSSLELLRALIREEVQAMGMKEAAA